MNWIPENPRGRRVSVDLPGKGKPDGGAVASGIPRDAGSDIGPESMQTGNDEAMSDIEMHNQLVGPGFSPEAEMAYYSMLDDKTAPEDVGGAKEVAAVMQEDKNQLKQIVNEIYERLIKKLKK